MQNKNNEALKNKFSFVEDKLLEQDIKQVLSIGKPVNPEVKKETYSTPGILWAMVKLNIKLLGTSWGSLQKSILKYSAKNITKSVGVIRSKKQSAEIVMGNYIADVEKAFAQKEIESEVLSIKKSEIISNFKKQAEQTFCCSNFSSAVNYEVTPFDMTEVFKRENELFQLMMEKIQEKNLNSNIFAVKIESFSDENSIHSRVEFELKTKGLKWALFIAKFVMNDLHEKVQKYQGCVSGEYVSNVTLGLDKYIFHLDAPLEMFAHAESTKQTQTKRRSLAELEN